MDEVKDEDEPKGHDAQDEQKQNGPSKGQLKQESSHGTVEISESQSGELEEKYASANWPLKGIDKPHKNNDVLYGRGGGTNHHPGNKRYRKFVEERKTYYMQSKRLEKPQIALDIVHMWRNQDPPGRFLKVDEETGLWSDVGDKKAREKTSQALREQAQQHREKAAAGGLGSMGDGAITSPALKRKRSEEFVRLSSAAAAAGFTMTSPPPNIRAVTNNGILGTTGVHPPINKTFKLSLDNAMRMYIACAQSREESAKNMKYDAQRMVDEAVLMKEEAKRLLEASSRMTREAQRMSASADVEMHEAARHLQDAISMKHCEANAIIGELNRAKSSGAEATKTPANEKQAEDSSEQQVVKHGVSFDENTKESVDGKSPLPQGWKEVFDQRTGKNYYFNVISNETRWTQPSAPPPPPPPPQAAPPLQAGWEEIRDQSSGKMYYFNPSTSETRWERPAAPPPPPPPPASLLGAQDGNAPPPPPPPSPRSPTPNTIQHWMKSGQSGTAANKNKDDPVNKEGVVAGLMKLQKSSKEQADSDETTVKDEPTDEKVEV